MAGGEDQASAGQEQSSRSCWILSEVESLFSVTKNLKHKAMLMLTYSAGLRVSETAKLRLTDIDSKRMTVRISQGKGGKRPLLHFIPIDS